MIDIKLRKDRLLEREDLFILEYNKYKDIFITRFKWNNLPFGMTSRIIEEQLFENGKLLFFKDKKMGLGYLVLPVQPFDSVNVYGEATRYNVYGKSYNDQLTIDDGVLIKNTYTMTPPNIYVTNYVNRIVDLDLAIEVNINATKQPIIAEGDEKSLLSLKNMYNQIIGNELVIFKNKLKDVGEGLTVHNTNVIYYAKDYYDMKKNYENELLTYLGIDNSNIDKKERNLVDEVNANNEIINDNLYKMLKTRQEACEEINKMFGLNISVELANDVEPVTAVNEESEEGESDGK